MSCTPSSPAVSHYQSQEKGSTWFNIDLGNETATPAPETEDIASNAKNAVVLHRNAAFYQVSGEGKQ
jgi:hypothetical protein